ncbi:MAG: PilZ domain-containing protein [Myxococcales bacterium]
MDLSAWLAAFRKLHDKARRKELDADEMKTYLTGRDELARAIVAAQRLTLRPGQTPRQAMRAARALAIDLDLAAGRVRALTMDLSRGGFSALLAQPPSPDDPVGFTLRIPSADPVIGRCKLVDSAKRQGSTQSSFAFEPLGEAELERIEMVLFDTVLEQFRGV